MLLTLASGVGTLALALPGGVREALVAVAIILILADVFFVQDWPTLLACVLLAVVAASLLPLGGLYDVVEGLVAFFALVALHYALWRGTVERINDRFIAPDRFRAGAEGLDGKRGVLRRVEGQAMVEIDGDLWPVEIDEPFEDGTRVRVEQDAGGALRIESR